jgi:nucleoside-diphosphate-sugar epimerase
VKSPRLLTPTAQGPIKIVKPSTTASVGFKKPKNKNFTENNKLKPLSKMRGFIL